MNRMQKLFLWWGIIAFVVMGICPPWVYKVEIGNVASTRDAGYYPIIAPPKPSQALWHSCIDLSRLCVQWAIVAAVTCGLVLTFADRKKKKSD